jgi:hypothetical protein
VKLKISLIALGLASLFFGLAMVGTRQLKDEHSVAIKNTRETSEPYPASEKTIISSTPANIPASAENKFSDTTAQVLKLASKNVQTKITPLPIPVEQNPVIPTELQPQPTPIPTPNRTIILPSPPVCGVCGVNRNGSKSGMIMCPMYCLQRAN